MPNVTPENKQKIIDEANRLTQNGLTTFGDIATAVFGSKSSAGIVGWVINHNRNQIQNCHKITSANKHPVADEIVFKKLIEDGYIIRNGVVELKG